ncbi:phage portal protein [Cohaesibacter celericrescens]|uniref:Phage portal protein n=1 Tax=Cohaesibacter celericrescens TaxID=2067669 RepID=A0A2N5XQL7_9HYPH|nr:phage portal protein [Cohaesibacter celericrescens]PLW76812.1 phage portal protein [Cohaesibacter celericrescens]
MSLHISINKKSAGGSLPLTSQKLAEMLVGSSSRSGVAVTEKTALQTAAAMCAGRVLSEGVAQVPLKLYRTEIVNNQSFKHEARDHWAWDLLHSKPNDWMTSFELREMMMYHAIFRGNGYCLKNISPVDGRVMELLPLENVNVTQNDDWSLTYTASDKKGVVGVYSHDQIIHFRGPMFSGFHGLPMVKLARETLGLSEALQNAQAKLQAKGGQPPGILSLKEGKVSDEAKNRLREAWSERYGASGEGGIAVLDGAWEFVATALNGVDSQHIESRRFQIEEVSRFFRVFPQMMMQADKSSTYASAEQFFIAHVVHTLGPWFVRFEQTFQRDLLSGENVDCEFVVDGLLRGAAKDRAEYFSKALGSGGSGGWMTKNEVRRKDNLNPLPGGDELPNPVEMAAPAQTDKSIED